jgi:cytochrome c oxidase cbb3-type subunit 3
LLLSLSANAQPRLDEALLLASPTTINADAALTQHMNTLAQSAISEYCAACHGADLQGQIGVPNLVDYEWLWGVTGLEMTSVEPVLKIMQTILYGVRDSNCPEETKRYGGCPDTRYSEMPGYGTITAQVDDLVEYVLDLAGEEADAEAVARAEPLKDICTECHGPEGYGDKVYGGPDLTDSVWLYGNTREQLRDVIGNGRKGTCPAWGQRLDPVTIKALAVYLYNKSMGG